MDIRPYQLYYLFPHSDPRQIQFIWCSSHSRLKQNFFAILNRRAGQVSQILKYTILQLLYTPPLYQRSTNQFWLISTVHSLHSLNCGTEIWGLRFLPEIGILHLFLPTNPLSDYAQKKNYKLLSRWYRDTVPLFWLQIFKIYTEIYDEPLTRSPTIALLSILPGKI